MNRTPKAPRMFAPRIPKTRFERKMLKRIPLSNEREFLLGLYTKHDDVYVRETELEKKDCKHLKRLAKAIKHNRGLFQPVKLGLLAAIAGLALAGVTVFLNPIVSSAIERGLEAAFVARSELSGLSLRPLVPGISFDALTVADRNQPLQNLFEVHDVRVELDLGQLIRGRIVIRDLDAGQLRFATGRSTSGALPADHPALIDGTDDRPAARTTLRSEAGSVVQEGVGQLLSLDVQEIVAAELSRLETPGVVDEQISLIRREITETRAELAELQTATEVFRSDAEGLLSTDPRTVSSIEQLTSLYTDTESVARDAAVILDSAAGVSRDIGASRARVEAAVDAISTAVDADVSGVQDRIPSASDVLTGPVAAFLEPHIMALIDPYRDTIDTLLSAVTWLQERSADQEDRSGVTRQGRTVAYPSLEYPRFLLERAAVGAASGAVQYQAELLSLSSDPEMTEGLPTARYGQRHNGRSAIVDAVFDLRRNASTPFDLALVLESQPIAFSVPNAPFSFSGLVGTFDLTAEARLVETGGTLSEELVAFLRVVPDDVQFVTEGLIVERVRSVIARAETVEIEVQAPAPQGEPAVRTNLDGPIREEIAAYLAEQRDAIVEQVEAEVRRQLDEQLSRYSEELDQLLSLYADLEEYIADARSLAARVTEQRTAIETRIAGLRGEVEDRVRAEAEAARQEAERRAREEAEAAAREAERRAREEAGRIIDSIRSPF
ncbi:MAG: hypothetical protein EA383_17820 [Spirochaetaceae bacterium]|nr:MAG: hypothetical protein EA383_17820 [Spirochaetaceae bacterium]